MSVSVYVRDDDGSRVIMNLSAVNFGRVWRLLGMEFTPSGEISGVALGDLLDSLTIVGAGLVKMPEFDDGVRETIEFSDRGAVLIECSLRAGYFTEKILALTPHVVRAIEQCGSISWS